MPIPTWSVGQVLASADVNNWFVPLAAFKPSLQAVTSSTTLVNDTQLFLPVAANAQYFFLLYLSYDGGTQGSSDLKFQFTGPSGGNASFSYLYYPTSGGVGANTNIARTTNLSTPVPIGTDGAGVLLVAYMIGTLTTASTSGTLQFQFAQNTSSATATTVHTGSALIAHRIG
jgi:hypothetical protein